MAPMSHFLHRDALLHAIFFIRVVHCDMMALRLRTTITQKKERVYILSISIVSIKDSGQVTSFLQSLASCGLCGFSNWNYNNHICGPYQQAYTNCTVPNTQPLIYNSWKTLRKCRKFKHERLWVPREQISKHALDCHKFFFFVVFFSIIPLLISHFEDEIYMCSNYLSQTCLNQTQH